MLLTGDCWSVGGFSSEKTADICVRADMPRHAGTIRRAGSDYFWQGARSTDPRILINHGQPIPIPGSAKLTLGLPSPLSDSAVLQLNAPHRFDQHVDGVVLVSETLLIGPGTDCHLRCRELADRAILNRRGDRWLAKVGLAGDFEELNFGQRMMFRSLAMMLEEA